MCTIPHIVKNCSFRRTLKHIKKVALKAGKPELHDLVSKNLASYGLEGDFYDLLFALSHNVKGRHYYRLGQAALRKNSLASLTQITILASSQQDLRKVKFHEKLPKLVPLDM